MEPRNAQATLILQADDGVQVMVQSHLQCDRNHLGQFFTCSLFASILNNLADSMCIEKEGTHRGDVHVRPSSNNELLLPVGDHQGISAVDCFVFGPFFVSACCSEKRRENDIHEEMWERT